MCIMVTISLLIRQFLPFFLYLVEMYSDGVECFLNGVTKDFEFCGSVDVTQDVINLFHNRIFNHIFVTILTLQNRQGLDDNNAVIADLKWQIGDEFL